MIDMASRLMNDMHPRNTCQVESKTLTYLVVGVTLTLVKTGIAYYKYYLEGRTYFPGCFRIIAHEFVVKSCFVYTAFLYLSFTYVLEQLTHCISGSKHVKEIYCRINRIPILLKHFDSVFSFLPLIWFTYDLISVVTVAHYFFNNSRFAWFTFLIISVNNVSIVFVLFSVTSTQKQIKQQLFMVEGMLATDRDLEKVSVVMVSVLNRIQSISSQNMTAFGFFDLNTSIILTFAAHLMTFTIMFLNFK